MIRPAPANASPAEERVDRSILPPGPERPGGLQRAAARREVDRSDLPPSPELLPDGEIEGGAYRLRFARTAEDIDRLLALRFEVFNLELGEGLDQSYETGRDTDDFDANCHHMLVERTDGTMIGTYRMQTAAMAAAGNGFYSAIEYDLNALPRGMREESVEIGRACIHRRHRKRTVLFLLWQGLARYMVHNRLRYLFGCCSLTSQDQAAGIRLYRQLVAAGKVRPDLDVPVLEHARCEASADVVAVRSEGRRSAPLRHLSALRRPRLQPARHRPRLQDDRLPRADGHGHAQPAHPADLRTGRRLHVPMTRHRF